VKLQVGKLPYLDSALFYFGLETNPETINNLEFVPLVPSTLSDAVRGEKIDAGPVPSVTMFEKNESYEPLGDFCIATVAKSRSILFFSRKPIGELDGARIGVTSETFTSARLLKVLFAQLYRVQPSEYVSIHEPNKGFLMIGDDALRNRKGINGYPYVTDLGEVWYDRTGLPFVFSRWVVRTGLPREQKDYLNRVIEAAMDEGWKHFDAMVADKIKELDMTRAEIREYLDGFHYRLGAVERESIAKFRELDQMTRKIESAEYAG